MPPATGNDAIGWRGNPPSVVGAHSGPLLIIGTGHTAPDDLRAYDHLHGGDRMLVNVAVMTYTGPAQHFATQHPKNMVSMLDTRYRGTDASPLAVHTPGPHDIADHVWPLDWRGGTTGLFATLIGLLMGYDPIVLAGIPMDDGGHHYDLPSPRPLTSNYRYGGRANALEWQAAAHQVFQGRVTSLSGRTRDWLGSPIKLGGFH